MTAIAITELLQVLKEQRGPDDKRVHMVGFDHLNVMLDQSDGQAATLIEAYIEAFPEATMGECVRALNTALFWMMLVLAIEPGEPESEAEDTGGYNTNRKEL